MKRRTALALALVTLLAPRAGHLARRCGAVLDVDPSAHAPSTRHATDTADTADTAAKEALHAVCCH